VPSVEAVHASRAIAFQLLCSGRAHAWPKNYSSQTLPVLRTFGVRAALPAAKAGSRAIDIRQIKMRRRTHRGR
jgi:hypothetical protein